MIVKPYTYGTYGDINLTVQFVRIFRMIIFLTAAGSPAVPWSLKP